MLLCIVYDVLKMFDLTDYTENWSLPCYAAKFFVLHSIPFPSSMDKQQPSSSFVP